MTQTINKIEFKDGRLELQKDNHGNLLMCAIGETAHKYYHKINSCRLDDSRLEKVFQSFNNCTLVI